MWSGETLINNSGSKFSVVQKKANIILINESRRY
jgi:hypothetical protein